MRDTLPSGAPLRRRALLGGLFAAVPLAANAEAWSPSRPIRLVVPFGVGGGTDITARLLAGPMGSFLGQPVVVENRPGAGASIGAGEVARTALDGHALLLDALAHVVTPALMRNLPFDYATAFTPISQTTILPQVLLVPREPAVRTLAELVDHLRRNLRRFAYGTPGTATASHLAAAVMLCRAGLEVAHAPYRGIGPALQDMVAGRLAFVFASVASGLSFAKDGKAQAVAVSSAARVTSLPEVPTVQEQGFPGFELNEWNDVLAPAGLPAAALERLNVAVRHALADTAVRERLQGVGAVGAGNSPEAFAAYLAEKRAEMAGVTRADGISVE